MHISRFCDVRVPRVFLRIGGRRLVTVLIFTAILVYIFCIWLYQTLFILSPENQPITYPHCRGSSKRLIPKPPTNAIHIALFLEGQMSFLRATTFLKSVFYFQGRFRTQISLCRQIRPMKTGACPLTGLPLISHIHVHFITDAQLEVQINRHFQLIGLEDFTWSIYYMKDYLPNVQWIPNTHRAGAIAMLRLVLPCVLPETVAKVIVADSDLLMNYDIRDLWDRFDQFDSHQALSFAWEQQTTSARCIETGTSPIPISGVNGGLCLLHLTKLRGIDWDMIWRTVVTGTLRRHLFLIQGEQDIFNRIIHLHPEMFYHLPCEWNVQLYDPVSVTCCHIVWPERDAAEADCITNPVRHAIDTRPNLLKLAHFNRSPKPEDNGVPVSGWKTMGNIFNRSLTYEERKVRFMEMYFRFRNIPDECFK